MGGVWACHVLDGDAANGPRAHGAEVTAHDDALEVAGVAVEDHHHLSVRRVALLKPVVHAEANSLVVVRDRARRESTPPCQRRPGTGEARPTSLPRAPAGRTLSGQRQRSWAHAPHVVICQHSIAHGVSLLGVVKEKRTHKDLSQPSTFGATAGP